MDLLSELPVGVAVVSEGRVLYSNPRMQQHLGSGERFPLHLPPGQHQVPSPVLEAGPLNVEVRSVHWQGKPATLYVSSSAESLGWTSEETERLAFEDSLTGLPNFNIIQQFIDFTCTQAKRYERSAALLVLDLDAFKELLNQVGADAGDELLVQVANRLQQTVRSSDIVGRRGQDEFMVLLTELTNDRSKERSLPEDRELTVKERAARVAERISAEFEKPFLAKGQPVTLHVSQGVTVCPEDARTLEEMLEFADAALAQAKAAGGGRFVVFDQSLARTRKAQQDQAQLLRERLASGNLDVEFRAWTDERETVGWEPVAKLDEHEVWSLAEAAGLAHELSEFLLEKLKNSERSPLILPLTARQLFHAGLAARLAEQFDSARVYFSVSDSVFRLPPSRRLVQLNQLQERGFRLAVDCTPNHSLSLGTLSAFKPALIRLSSGDQLLPIYRELANHFGSRVVLAK